MTNKIDNSYSYNNTLLYYFRKNLPKTSLFFIANTLLNMIGVFLCTHDQNYAQTGNLTINSIISKITISSLSTTLNSDYCYISITIFTLLVLYILFILVLYCAYLDWFKTIYKEIQANELFKPKIKIPIKYKQLFRYCLYISIIILFISQHLVEFLSFGSLNLASKNKIYFQTNNNSSLTENKLSVNYVVLGILNILSICFILIIKLLSLILIQSQSIFIIFKSNTISLNGLVIFTQLLFIFTQSIYSFCMLLDNETRQRIKRYVNIIIVITLLLIEIISTSKYYFTCISLRVKKWINILCFVSGLIEIFSNLINPNYFITYNTLWFKLIAEISLTTILFFTISFYKYRYYLAITINDLFNESKERSYGGMLFLTHQMNKLARDPTDDNFAFFFSMLDEHLALCKKKSCQCQRLLKENKLDYKKFGCQKKDIFNSIAVLIENEIKTAIYALKKSNNYYLLTKMILLHIDYVLYIQKQYFYAYYLTQTYYESEKSNLSSLSSYFFFEIKRYLLQEMCKHNKIKPTKLFNFFSFENLEYKKKKEPIKRMIIRYDYLYSIENIKQIMHKSCMNIDKILVMRNQDIHNKNILLKAEDIMHMFTEYDYQTNKIKQILKIFIEKYKIDAIPDLAYLIYHYYIITEGEIPKFANEKIKKMNGSCFNYFSDYKLTEHCIFNPLVAYLDNKDDFLIQYISQPLCDKLGYRANELYHSNINILIPEIFWSSHLIYMKLFTLFSTKSYSRQTYALNKNQMLLSVYLKGCIIPSFSNNFILFFDVIFDHNENRETTDFNHNKFSYSLILDQGFDFISFTSSFSNDFFIDRNMILDVKIDFCKLFGLNYDKLKLKLKTEDKVAKTKEYLEEVDNAISIKAIYANSSSNLKKYTQYHQLFHHCNFPLREIFIRKENVLKSVYKIQSWLEDGNRNLDYLNKLKSLQLRLQASIDLSKENEKEFKCKFMIKHIGDIKYYIVTIEESLEDKLQLIKEIDIFKSNIDKITFAKDLNKKETLRKCKKEMIEKAEKIKQHYEQNHPMNLIINPNSFNESHIQQIDPLSTLNSLLYKQITVTELTSAQEHLNEQHNDTGKSFNNSRILGNSNYFNMTINKSKNGLLVKRRSIPKKQTKKKEKEIILYSHSSITNNRNNNCIKPKTIKILFEFMVLVFVLILIAINILNLITNQNMIKISTSLFSMNYNAILIKSDIYISALFYLTSCLTKEYQMPVDPGLMWKFNAKANQIVLHLLKIHQEINSLSKEELSNGIYELLSEEKDYLFINEDYDILTRRSQFSEELMNIRYVFMTIANNNDFTECRISSYLKSNDHIVYLPSNIISEFSKSIYQEQLLFYFIQNTLKPFKSTIDQLANMILVTLQSYLMKFRRFLITTSFILISCIVLFYLMFLLKLLKDKKDIEELFFVLLSKHPKDLDLNEKIKTFMITIKEFKYSNIIDFETSSGIKKKNFGTLIPFEQFNTKIIQSTIIHTRRKSIAITNKIKIEETLNQDNVLYMPNKALTQLAFISRAVVVLIILFVLLIIFQLYVIFELKLRISNLIFQTLLEINFLERIPLLAESALYYIITIMLNYPDYIVMPQVNYSNNIFSNYYNIQLGFETDSVYSQLNNSQYAFLIYKLSITRNNILKVKSDKHRNALFNNTLTWEDMLDTKDLFPLYATIGYNSFDQSRCLKGIVSCFKCINKDVEIFISPGNKMNLKGFNLVLDTMTQEMNMNYLDYLSNKQNGTKKSFVLSKQIMDIFDNDINILQAVHLVLTEAIIQDLSFIFNECKESMLILSIISISINLMLLYAGFVLLIRKVNNYRNLLMKTKQRFDLFYLN